MRFKISSWKIFLPFSRRKIITCQLRQVAPWCSYLIAFYLLVPNPASSEDLSGFQVFTFGKNIEEITGLSEVPLNGGPVHVIGNLRNGSKSHAFYWTQGNKNIVDLHSYLKNSKTKKGSSFATGIGTGIVGYHALGSRSGVFPFWFIDGEMIDLVDSPLFSRSKFTAINTQGEIAAYFGVGSRSKVRKKFPAFGGFFGGSTSSQHLDVDVVNSPSWLPLSSLSTKRKATKVNNLITDALGNNGVYVGVSRNDKGKKRAVWGNARTGEIVDLGSFSFGEGYLSNKPSTALAINGRGQIVGSGYARSRYAPTNRPAQTAILWNPGYTAIEIGHIDPKGIRLVQQPFAKAVDINDSGFAVGGSGPRLEVLFVLGVPGQFKRHEMRHIFLNDILPDQHPKGKHYQCGPRYHDPGWYPTKCISKSGAINNAGIIAGTCEEEGILAIPKYLLMNKTIEGPPAIPKALGISSPDRREIRWEDQSTNELWFEIEMKVAHLPWIFIGASPANHAMYCPNLSQDDVGGKFYSPDNGPGLGKLLYENKVGDIIKYRVRAVNYKGASGYSEEMSCQLKEKKNLVLVCQ